MSTLVIAVDDSSRTLTFSLTSGPTGATVGSSGDIDISACNEADIDLEWNLSTGSFSTTGNAVTISGNGNNQVFGDPVLTNNNKTCTVSDSNPTNPSNSNFTYQIHEQNSQFDPAIRNRS